MNKPSVDSISPAHLPPRFRARYRFCEKLGEGGVALVYRVSDLHDDNDKALKILKPSYNDDPKAVARFEQEFRILRGLHHPNLPGVYDYGVSGDGSRSMVMELVEGVPLDRYFKKHPDEIWLLLLEIAEALEFIHEHNLLHLDLKPDNILVRRTGAYGDEKPLITLIDFGLSFRRESTSSVKVVGTPAYMAPEIIRGSGRITRAVDYYSLGVTLFELLEGHTPFRGKLEEVLKAHLAKKPKFGPEQIEFAELYPRVRQLLSKEISVRLDAFGDFRRSLSARAGAALQGLARAYGMGFLDSIGPIGKTEPIDRLDSWIERISKNVAERTEEMQRATLDDAIPDDEDSALTVSASKPLDKLVMDSAILEGKSGEIDRKIREDLLAAAHEKERVGVKAPTKGPARNVSRLMAIAGPAGSGKSYCIDMIQAECLVHGMTPVVMGQDGGYEALVAEADGWTQDTPPVDPRSVIIDRFVRGWERLAEAGRQGGALLMLDGYHAASQEEREFLEYVGKRLELSIDEGKEPGVFVVVSGKTARLRNILRKLLPKSVTIDRTVLPLPASEDVEEIVAEFHGHLPGVDDRKRLGDYLLAHSESAGALANALRTALVRGGLIWDAGQWRFAESVIKPDKHEATENEYYRELLSELETADRDVIAWLSCQRGWIAVPSFEAVSGIEENKLDQILERMNTFRIIDIKEENKTTCIGITSEGVRKAIYQLLNKEERSNRHSAYLHFLSTREPDAASCESMAFHYESIGETRKGLLMRIRAFKLLKEAREIFGMRRLCEEGIRITARLRAQKWKTRKWHLERYFIKQWIEAEWMVSNFKGLIDVVDKHIYKKNRRLPLSFAYMYGMALRSVGEFNKCGELVEFLKGSIKKKNIYSEAFLKVLLVEAALLNNLGEYQRSNALLDQISSHIKMLDEDLICRSYVYAFLNYHALGELAKYEEIINNVRLSASRNKYYDDLLLVEYYDILALFNRSIYGEAKRKLKSNIILASNNKLYYRLGTMYHLLSGIYFEEGDYRKALYALGKTIKIAENIGMNKWVNDSRVRYSLIYQSMGLISDAQNYARLAESTARDKNWLEDRFYSLVQLLQLDNIINYSSPSHYKTMLESIPKTNIHSSVLGFYYFVLGDYYYKRSERSKAIQYYAMALDVYEVINYQDDAARSLIRLANIYSRDIDDSRYSEAILKLTEKLKLIESKDIQFEYNCMILSYYHFKDCKDKNIYNSMAICEGSLEKINNIELRINGNMLLFQVNRKLGNANSAIRHFNMYYSLVKHVISNIPAETRESDLGIVMQLQEMVKEFKLISDLKTKRNQH